MKGIIQKGKELRKEMFRKEEGDKRRVFGGTIQQNGEGEEIIPVVVSKCVEYLDSSGLEFEGLFRKSGSLNQLNEYKARFERGEDVDLSGVQDPHIVAGLLKMYVRELAEPLLTFELYDMFLATVAIKDVSAKLTKLRQVLSFLPRENLYVVRYLVEFLNRVSAKSSANMMTPSNLAIVFAPNLLRPQLSGEQEIAVIVEDTPFSNELLQIFISNFHSLFDGVASEAASEPKLMTDTHKEHNRAVAHSMDVKKPFKPLPPIPQTQPEPHELNEHEEHPHESVRSLHHSHENIRPLPTKPISSSSTSTTTTTTTTTQQSSSSSQSTLLRKSSSDSISKPLPNPTVRRQPLSPPISTSTTSPAFINNNNLSTSPPTLFTPPLTSSEIKSANPGGFFVFGHIPSSNSHLGSESTYLNPLSPPPVPLPSPPKKTAAEVAQAKQNRHARAYQNAVGVSPSSTSNSQLE